MLDKDVMVEVESIGRGAVGYQPLHNTTIKRIWHKPGIVKTVSLEEIKEVFTSPGGELLFANHLLIKDEKVREELGLSLEKERMFSEKELEGLLTGNPSKLKEQMPKLTKEQKLRIADKAIEMEIDNVSKIHTIKEYSGVDVYKVMQAKKEQA